MRNLRNKTEDHRGREGKMKQDETGVQDPMETYKCKWQRIKGDRVCGWKVLPCLKRHL